MNSDERARDRIQRWSSHQNCRYEVYRTQYALFRFLENKLGMSPVKDRGLLLSLRYSILHRQLSPYMLTSSFFLQSTPQISPSSWRRLPNSTSFNLLVLRNNDRITLIGRELWKKPSSACSNHLFKHSFALVWLTFECAPEADGLQQSPVHPSTTFT